MTGIQAAPIKILSLVEATTINAVAKNVLEFHRVARELSEQSPDFPKIEACIVTFERNPDPARLPNAFVSLLRRLELPVEIIRERRRFDLSAIASLQRIVRQQNPGLIVTHSVKSHFLMWRSHLRRAYPWAAFHHGYTTTDLKMRAYNRLDRWSLPNADRLITVCHAFARELASSTGVELEKISVQHNSVQPGTQIAAADVQSLKTRLGIASDERVVLTVGRLSREKAHADLLAAYQQLRITNPDISSKLIIVGDGPEREKLEAAVQTFGLKDRVIFTGQVSEVQPFYAAADVFVLPSHSEGSPNVLLEAMGANLPIVATAVGGVPEIVTNNESALLVPMNAPQTMAAAVTRLLTDHDLAERLTANAATLVATRYAPAQYVRALVEIYREVINAKSSGGKPTFPT